MNPKQLINKIVIFFKQLPYNFRALSLEEKIAYGLVALGALLIIVSLILF